MTSRIIEYGDDQWKATADGLGVGVSTGRPASVTRWGMRFKCVSDRGKGSYRGHIRDPNPDNVSDEELRKALKRAIEKSVKQSRQAAVVANGDE